MPWATQLTKRLGFDLADALACHAKCLSYLFEYMLRGAADAEPRAYDALLTGRRWRKKHWSETIAFSPRRSHFLVEKCA